MKHYNVSFPVIYDDYVEADDPKEAADLAMDYCQYDVDGGAYVVCEETGEEFDFR